PRDSARAGRRAARRAAGAPSDHAVRDRGDRGRVAGRRREAPHARHLPSARRRALHRIMPFVTEEIAAALPGADGRFLMQGTYPPRGPGLSPTETQEMDALVATVTKMRQLRGELGVPPATQLRVTFPTAAAPFVRRH